MTTFIKNGVEMCMPDDDEKSRQNMIIAAEFMARMIQKYGKKVLAKIEERDRKNAEGIVKEDKSLVYLDNTET